MWLVGNVHVARNNTLFIVKPQVHTYRCKYGKAKAERMGLSERPTCRNDQTGTKSRTHELVARPQDRQELAVLFDAADSAGVVLRILLHADVRHSAVV